MTDYDRMAQAEQAAGIKTRARRSERTSVRVQLAQYTTI